MTSTDAIRKRWVTFFRRGPYALLGLAGLLSAVAAGEVMTPGERYPALALFAVAVALQIWWSRAARALPEYAPVGQVYYAVRTALGFALTWLNPFFAIYAVLGYFDAGHLLPRRLAYAGYLVTAVIMAGSQSGGLPPEETAQWLAFGALYLLNASLALVAAHLAGEEADLARANEAMIAELELANARLEQALKENAGLHAQLLVQAREAGVNDERRRLAAEIHDTLAQGLAGIITQLQAAADGARPAEHIERAAALARHNLVEARRSVHDLTPGALEHDGLVEALKRITAESPGVELTVTGTAEPLHDEIEATLLRIAQEALANAARHAAASRIGVTLSYMDDEVILDVRDDGRGFDASARPSGFGLRGMRARAERVAGALDVESEPGQGTAISARVPLVGHG